MKRRLVVLVAATVVLASCTGDEPPAIPEPAAVEEVATCDGVVDVAEDYVRIMAEELETAPLDVVTGDAPATPRLAALEEVGAVIDRRRDRLGCDPDEFRTAVNERVADLETDDPIVAIFLDIVRDRGVPGR